MVCKKTALISGVSGQDGFYLTKLLLDQGYRVVGIDRRTSSPTNNKLNIFKGTPNFILVPGDITDISSVKNHLNSFKPDEFYHLAAQSDVGVSWDIAISTAEITGLGVLNCLEAIRQTCPDCKFYFAGSSEQFGNSIKRRHNESKDSPRHFISLNEESIMQPESPYAAAKVFGYNICQVYKKSYNMFISCGILFNHESPVRGYNFVTRKITSELARVKHGLQDKVHLGNMSAARDWGFAADYCMAMHMILQHHEPDNFVIGTGKAYSVRDFFNAVCNWYGLDPDKVYEINPKYMRPNDVGYLLADASKAENVLGWKPTVNFDGLVDLMCSYDYCLQSPHDAERRQADYYLFPLGGK